MACRMHQQLTFESNGTVSVTAEELGFSEAVICMHLSHLTVIKYRVDIFITSKWLITNGLMRKCAVDQM